MRRRLAILISLIILLLIGGGAVAFYSHLRKQAPPEFSEVDQFIRAVPASTNWRLVATDETVLPVPGDFPWLERFGINRGKIYQQHHYIFIGPSGANSVAIIVTHDAQRITDLNLQPDGKEIEGFRGQLLEKFPRLGNVVRIGP